MFHISQRFQKAKLLINGIVSAEYPSPEIHKAHQHNNVIVNNDICATHHSYRSTIKQNNWPVKRLVFPYMEPISADPEVLR